MLGSRLGSIKNIVEFSHYNDFSVRDFGEAESWIDIEPVQKWLILFQIQIFSNV